jgi:hypothetical protein
MHKSRFAVCQYILKLLDLFIRIHVLIFKYLKKGMLSIYNNVVLFEGDL